MATLTGRSATGDILAAAGEHAMFVVVWNEGAVKGYRDLYEEDVFRADADVSSVEHLIIPKGGREHVSARFSLKVTGLRAVLDYAGGHAEHNEGRTDVGQVRITFSDDTFTEIAGYEWCPAGGEYFAPDVTIEDGPADQGEAEGDPVLREHMRRERKPVLVKRKIAAVLSEGRRLACEACSFDFGHEYGEVGAGCCEVHHRLPLQAGTRITSLADLAVLCANCHRVIHRHAPMMSVEALRDLLEQRRSASATDRNPLRESRGRPSVPPP